MDEYDGGVSPLATATALIVSTRASNSALGSAEKQIDDNSTIPTSSASPSCASLAAASNSFATAQLMANVRSPPSDDSASVAPPAPSSVPISVTTSNEEEYQVTDTEFKQALSESVNLTRQGQLGPMRLRRLLFSRNDPYVAPSQRGISKKRTPASARSRYPICFASIFGATLKTILDFSGVATDKKTETAAALHEMLQFLEPVEESISRMHGSDQPHLVNGLATHRVSRKQGKFMPECSGKDMKNSWLSRSGLKDVTMGVTAAVLVAHYVMAATGSDATEVSTNLARCTEGARSALAQWDMSRTAALSIHKAALGAEIRALERAAAAAKAAEKVACATGLDRMMALHLQLSYMRSAAWPGNTTCSANRHEHMVNAIGNGDPLETVPEEHMCSMPSIPVLQLLRLARDPVGGGGSGSELSSLASSSSAASSIGDEDLGDNSLSAAEEAALIGAVDRMRRIGMQQ